MKLLWTAAAALTILVAAPARADAPLVCSSLEMLVSKAHLEHRAIMVLDGWMGEALAQRHKEWTGYTPPEPVSVVLLERLKDGMVRLSLHMGQMSCQPVNVPESEWRSTVMALRGRGA